MPHVNIIKNYVSLHTSSHHSMSHIHQLCHVSLLVNTIHHCWSIFAAGHHQRCLSFLLINLSSSICSLNLSTLTSSQFFVMSLTHTTTVYIVYHFTHHTLHTVVLLLVHYYTHPQTSSVMQTQSILFSWCAFDGDALQ